jgi:hypothetical protein
MISGQLFTVTCGWRWHVTRRRILLEVLAKQFVQVRVPSSHSRWLLEEALGGDREELADVGRAVAV